MSTHFYLWEHNVHSFGLVIHPLFKMNLRCEQCYVKSCLLLFLYILSLGLEMSVMYNPMEIKTLRTWFPGLLGRQHWINYSKANEKYGLNIECICIITYSLTMSNIALWPCFHSILSTTYTNFSCVYYTNFPVSN